MKRFIFKTLFFILPFIFLYLMLIIFGSEKKGDLIRVGYLIDNTKNYREIFKNDFEKKITYTELTGLNNQKSFDVLTMGDSFSQKKGYGYQNYLSEEGINVLHYNQSCNSMLTLNSFIEGDVFDELNIKYVLIQSVERFFINRSKNVFQQKNAFLLKGIKEDQNHTKTTAKKFKLNLPKLFSPGIIKLPLNSLLYQFDDNAFFSNVYRVKLSKELFSTGNKELLFLNEDYRNVKNTNRENIQELNNVLNLLSRKLENKGVKLIVLPSPDKYSLYYKYFEDKNNYPKPIFFDNLSNCKKEYLFINSKEVLNKVLEEKKDLYFYDDTHWSPLASELIAEKIKEVILSNN